MTNVISIYTRTGDDGTTGLANGERRTKSDDRIAAIGSIDELNASIGVVIAELNADTKADAYLAPILKRVQNTLFSIGSSLALVAGFEPGDDEIQWMEEQIDQIQLRLPPLSHFILPGGCRIGAELHRARTSCRRAERETLHLSQFETVHRSVNIYLNRLSDLLFVMARDANQQSGHAEEHWITS
jgi:cob(I)alamin adenosyltransferase